MSTFFIISLENPHYYHKLTLLVTVDTLFDTLEDIIKNRNNTETYKQRPYNRFLQKHNK